MKKIYIKESKEHLLTEGLSNILYHFTSLNHGYKICKDDKIYLQSAYAKDADNYDRKRKFYLSCTRIGNSQFGYSKKFSQGGVRIVLDGSALATKYKGKQVNYWGGGTFTDKYGYTKQAELNGNAAPNDKAHVFWLNRWKKEHPNASEEEIQNWINHNFYDDVQHHISNESEDRIFSYEPMIPNAHRYIKSVDVLIVDFEKDPNKMALAQSFLYRTLLGSRYVKIFDSEKEFNNPNGKDANDKVEYGEGYVSEDRLYYRKVYDCLEAVICFIAYANHDFDGKNFPKKTMEYLTKYELSEFKNKIGTIMAAPSKTWGGIQGIAEKLDAVRRYLSDEPNEYTYKISKMLTDYCLSIGANSFREAYLIKKNMENEYYDLQRGNVYDRIDTNKKCAYLIVRRGVISLYPQKDKFSDAMGWDDEYCKSYADSFAGEIMYDNEGKYNRSRSKNYNSMFQYLYKLFRVGTIAQVYETLKKIGLDDEYLKSWDIDMEYKELDYWEAVRYNTVNTAKLNKEGDYDYMALARKNDREIENFIKQQQKVSNV
jgi:hypothetical protein